MNTSSTSANDAALHDWLRDSGGDALAFPPESALGRLLAGPGDRPSRPAAAGPAGPVRVLMLLCQKIGSTGSGVVVKEMVDRAASVGVEYGVVCGGYDSDEPGRLFRVPPALLEVVPFNTPPPDGVPFPIAGMSNSMPYPSVTFKDLGPAQIQTYLDVWAGTLRRAIAGFRPHLLHVHHLWLLTALAALEAPDLPLVVSLHGTDLFRAADAPHLRELIRPWAARVDRVLSLTEESSSVARRLYPLRPDACEAFGNGFNEALFHPNRDCSSEILSRYGLTGIGSRPVVLTVAKFDGRKGIEWLLRAFARIMPRAPAPVLVVAGGGPPEEGRRYHELAASLGVAERVIFTGPLAYEDVGALMNRAEVFVLPSFHEPFGLVILEALACGCRVVTTDQAGPHEFVPASLREAGDASLVPGLPSLNPDGETADRFVADLARATGEHLSRPLTPEDRRRISAAVSHLTWAGYVARLGRLYHHLLSGGTDGTRSTS